MKQEHLQCTSDSLSQSEPQWNLKFLKLLLELALQITKLSRVTRNKAVMEHIVYGSGSFGV